ASQPNITGCAGGTTGYTCIGGGGALPPPIVNNFPPATVESKIYWPYVQQWHLDVQRDLPAHIIGTVSYVGSKGTHLTDVRDLNQMHPLPASQNPYGPGQPLTASDCATLGTANPTANGVPVTPGTPLFANFKVACSGGGANADPFRPFLGISSLEFL